MTEPDPGPRHIVQSVDHAAQILLLFEESREVRVTEVARRLGIAPSTAHRLLTTLEARMLVVQDRVSRTYRVGPSLVEIGVRSTSSFDLRAVAEPHMRRLVREAGETVNLMVLNGPSIRFVAGLETTTQAVRTHVLTGTLLPAYATSGGKVLLAELSREELKRLYPHGLRKLTPRTRTFTQLVDELSLVIMRGYAVNRGESSPGLTAVAVPLKDQTGTTIAALAMSAPTERMDRARIREAVVHLRAYVAAIRQDLHRYRG
ncbi:IclR family transcriptional regulator [Citricoccus sp. SGAir0253]|uniref:IclR family transcriptional regulator n=1 Tax=Citricoccus sp. SGAir0253 TaxID=2567881 RepID=UPI0010CCF217|nr:IclR family transcriptional regulator [Citricoccus sp. SGAir0253]QCU77570.1 IclR family transcriptional regulator [Citricoccus sp. SGAir0253]